MKSASKYLITLAIAAVPALANAKTMTCTTSIMTDTCSHDQCTYKSKDSLKLDLGLAEKQPQYASAEYEASSFGPIAKFFGVIHVFLDTSLAADKTATRRLSVVLTDDYTYNKPFVSVSSVGNLDGKSFGISANNIGRNGLSLLTVDCIPDAY